MLLSSISVAVITPDSDERRILPATLVRIQDRARSPFANSHTACYNLQPVKLFLRIILGSLLARKNRKLAEIK
jgi:hypothetical protein